MSALPLHPLVFRPILKELVWGGRRLTQLGKALEPTRPFGESWELVDLAVDQSVVAGGPLQGTTLQQLVHDAPSDLLGPVRLDGGRFPLLVKYIDAAQALSVQVHPGETAVRAMGHGRPKAEAWFVIDAEPGAVLYLGLTPGITRAQVERAVGAKDGGQAMEALLQALPARPGDLLAIPPGTVHAIGAGVLLAEVQQPSDTTYRIYDWGRVGLDGKPRAVHVEEALACMDLQRRIEPAGEALDLGSFAARVVSPVAGDSPLAVSGAGPRVVVSLAGRTALGGPAAAVWGEQLMLEPGTVVLLPHCVQDVELAGSGRALLVTFPRS